MGLLDIWSRLCRAHRSQDETLRGGVREFFLPRPTRNFFIRAAAVTLVAVVVFGWLLIPFFFAYTLLVLLFSELPLVLTLRKPPIEIMHSLQ